MESLGIGLTSLGVYMLGPGAFFLAIGVLILARLIQLDLNRADKETKE
jgi:hypothetical protein